MNVSIQWVEQQRIVQCCTNISTAFGNLRVYQTGKSIHQTEWTIDQSSDFSLPIKDNRVCLLIHRYLHNPISQLEVQLIKQGSAFRHKVWREICNIPVGQTISYTELAKRTESGARAVANACRDNPFPGIIPCHRVVSLTGLGGYMGQTSGQLLGIKQKLLEYETGLKGVE